MFSSKQNLDVTEMEKSRRALQFVEKISKESLKRRMRFQEKANQMKMDLVSNHVSVCCSRVKCVT